MKWTNLISKTHGQHNLPVKVWERICKIRSRPVEIVRHCIFGSTSRPHIAVPKGSKGYVVDHIEAFRLSEDQRQAIKQRPPNTIPIALLGLSEVLFFSEHDFRVTSPFFDIHLANLAEVAHASA